MRPKRFLRLICAFVCTLLLTILFTSCQPKPSSGGGPSGTGGKHKLAFVTNNASPFWVIARKGTEKAAADIPNIEVDFRIPSDGTAASQQSLVDDLLANRVEGVAISPVDPKNQTEMLNRAAAQTIVVTQDSDAPSSNRVCYIGTDNVAAGRQAGELVKQALPNGGKIMVFVGVLDAANAQQRFQGLKEALAGSNITIVDVRTDATDRVRAKSNASDTLVNFPDVVGMVGLWSYNGPAILSAVKDANKVDKVKIIAFDEEDETLAGVKNGEIYATVVQQPFEFGYRSMELMSKILNGDKSGIPASKQIFVPTIAVKKDNVVEFTKQLNQRLGKG
ncbi:MAG TPA: sugar-binding protein [Pyrinomonadaceae bacterium]|jgi:ribose transport system substrate-binding protein|nr:sugar-binding protein [Pyrinomonadaceae bacterium]